jgi:hypothetical protein
MVATGEGLSRAEVLDELVSLEQVGVPAHHLDRGLELRAARARHRRADLVHEDLAERIEVVAQRLVELAQASHPECVVARPRGRVERASRRRDRALGVGDAGVGGGAEDRLRGRRDGPVGGVLLGAHQLAVDEQPVLVPDLHCDSGWWDPLISLDLGFQYAK